VYLYVHNDSEIPGPIPATIDGHQRVCGSLRRHHLPESLQFHLSDPMIDLHSACTDDAPAQVRGIARAEHYRLGIKILDDRIWRDEDIER